MYARIRGGRVRMDARKSGEETVFAELANAFLTDKQFPDATLMQEILCHFFAVLTTRKAAVDKTKELGIRLLLRCLLTCVAHWGVQASTAALGSLPYTGHVPPPPW
jgi:hypothetical protein